MVTVIDGKNLLLGRMCSLVSKRILSGEEIAIINSEKVIVSGSRAKVIEEYYQKRMRGSVEGGPFYPRRPDQIVKRTVRGMIPYKTKTGAAAFRRVKTYVGIPYELKDKETEVLETAHRDRLSSARYITIGAISTNLGAKY